MALLVQGTGRQRTCNYKTRLSLVDILLKSIFLSLYNILYDVPHGEQNEHYRN